MGCPSMTAKTKIKLLLAYLVPVLAISPSLVWIALDKTVWSWDRAWYGKISVELFYYAAIEKAIAGSSSYEVQVGNA